MKYCKKSKNISYIYSINSFFVDFACHTLECLAVSLRMFSDIVVLSLPIILTAHIYKMFAIVCNP